MALLKEVSKNYGKLDLHINGKWVTPQTGKYFDVTNPATGRVIAKAPVAGPDDVEKAIAAAHAAFGKWRNVPFRDRAKLIFNLRDTFMKHHEELARILVQDHGCTISDGRGTISRCVENIESAGSSMYGLDRKSVV